MHDRATHQSSCRDSISYTAIRRSIRLDWFVPVLCEGVTPAEASNSPARADGLGVGSDAALGWYTRPTATNLLTSAVRSRSNTRMLNAFHTLTSCPRESCNSAHQHRQRLATHSRVPHSPKRQLYNPYRLKRIQSRPRANTDH